MAYYHIPDPEQLIECPYDKVHMVAAKRMQYHLMKCRRNFTGREFATCPFNARHEMPKPELRYHIANCPDKAMLEPVLSYEQSKNTEEGRNFKGCTDLPKYDDAVHRSRHSENWDEEIPENPRIGVDPAYFARLEYKDLSGMSRSEKKTWRQQYHLPPDQRKFPKQEKEEEEEDQLRKPRIKPSKFMQAQPVQQESQVLNYSLAMAGIGRGGAMAAHKPQSAGRAMGRAEKMSAGGFGVGRAQNEHGVGHAMGMSASMPQPVGRAIGRGMPMLDSMPPVGRAVGRAAAMNNFAQYSAGGLANGNTVGYFNGTTNGYTNGLVEDRDIIQESQGLEDQFADVDKEIIETGNDDIPLGTSLAAGIGRGRGSPPAPPAFTVGRGRGMLRDLDTSPAFVVPIVNTTVEQSKESKGQEMSINADSFVDAKKKESKKIQKKLKEIGILEEKAQEGYKLNSEEVLKVKAKEKLEKALEELTL